MPRPYRLVSEPQNSVHMVRHYHEGIKTHLRKPRWETLPGCEHLMPGRAQLDCSNCHFAKPNLFLPRTDRDVVTTSGAVIKRRQTEWPSVRLLRQHVAMIACRALGTATSEICPLALDLIDC